MTTVRPVTFSAQLRELTAPTWNAAVGHRFVDEIWRGEIDGDVLAAYLVQDHQFVDAFLALMGAAVASADRAEARVVHARQLGIIAGPENDFFARALDTLDVPLTDRTYPELQEPTSGFIALMDTARTSADYPSCLAVLLVAEWLYLDWATRPDATDSMSLFCINHKLAISDDDSMRHGNGLRPALLRAVSRRLRIGVAGGHNSQSY